MVLFFAKRLQWQTKMMFMGTLKITSTIGEKAPSTSLLQICMQDSFQYGRKQYLPIRSQENCGSVPAPFYRHLGSAIVRGSLAMNLNFFIFSSTENTGWIIWEDESTDGYRCLFTVQSPSHDLTDSWSSVFWDQSQRLLSLLFLKHTLTLSILY